MKVWGIRVIDHAVILAAWGFAFVAAFAGFVVACGVVLIVGGAVVWILQWVCNELEKKSPAKVIRLQAGSSKIGGDKVL